MDRVPKVGKNHLLAHMPVEFPIAGGGTFFGRLTITRFDIDPATRALTITGELSGRAMSATGGVMKTADGRPAVIPAGKPVAITNVPVVLRRGDGVSGVLRPAQATCDILLFDLGPIHLDLLGLVLNVSQIIIDLDAQTGAGNLLGNLLCALLGLFDAAGALANILAILDVVNNLLQGLGSGAPAA